MTLVAKPILTNKLWVVTDDEGKVGNIELTNKGYNLTINGKQHSFDSTQTIESMTTIKFQRPQNKKNLSKIPYAIWPTDGETYNDLFDVQRKLHLFTREQNSKCYYVAGWFDMNINGVWQTILCPKYIFISRYEYKGPFISEEAVLASR